jgi:hypothetical protein
MRRLSLTVAAIVSCASPLSAQEKSDVRRVQLSVAADDSAWMTTGLMVDEGDRIDVHATGMISVSRFWFKVDANGISKLGWGERGSRYLEYRIGEELPKPAGKMALVTANTAGLLQFRVHDDDYDDNYGSLTVDVVVMSGDALPAPSAPNDLKPDLGGVIALMKYTLGNIVKVADQTFATKGYYDNPFSGDRVTLPPGITTNGFTSDEHGFSVIVKHFDPPKARCAVAYNMRNPLDPSVGDRQIACQWRDFDPAW